MFLSKLSVIATLATVAAAQAGGGESACNVGKLECCQTVQEGNSEAAQKQLSALGLVVNDVKGLIGIQCSPISALIGKGTGSNCNANPVCCSGNRFNGVVAIGCTPINVNV